MKINNFSTAWGDQLYLLGNVPELGGGDENKAIGPLFNKTSTIAEYPNWFYDVSLPVNTDIQYQFVKKDQNGKVLWKSDYNNFKTGDQASTITLKE
ncbi:carbohydrate-binding module family 20 domain-containing protein [Streptococcus sp. X13SY08]|uniref:carbohydrate-binding module family 20 domain-containing protein n=1 Tax=unclassified Streptococcus TaxID=2608887 RepID=UPI000A45DD72|nr:carbohydrate-binding module family 20 domain-containing protein [Streptococcus sp. X13SY08]